MDTNIIWVFLLISSTKILKRFVSLCQANYPIIVKHEAWSDSIAVVGWMILLGWCLHMLSL